MLYNYKHGLKTGDTVKIVRQHKYKTTNLIGKIGTVQNEYGVEVLVKIDGMRNTYSQTGYYYFKPRELELVNENGNTMEEENVMPNVTNYINAVKIQFVDNNSPCSYIYANYESDLKVGDLCVVKSAHHGLGLARIVEILEGNNYETPREIVSKVNTTFYDERVKFRAKRAELKAEMEKRAKQLQDIALYQMLAKDDPDMAEMLTRYQNVPQM